MTSNKRILAIDLGEKKAGLAIYYGKEPIIRAGLIVFSNEKQIPEKLKKIISEKNPDLVVFGLPTDKEGEMTKQAKWVKRQAEKVSNIIDREIKFVDEYLTTWQAEVDLGEKAASKNNFNGEADQRAAEIILNDYLESK